MRGDESDGAKQAESARRFVAQNLAEGEKFRERNKLQHTHKQGMMHSITNGRK